MSGSNWVDIKLVWSRGGVEEHVLLIRYKGKNHGASGRSCDRPNQVFFIAKMISQNDLTQFVSLCTRSNLNSLPVSLPVLSGKTGFKEG